MEIIVFWELHIVVSCQKLPKSDIQSQFSMPKSNFFFSVFFSFKKINLGAHFFVKGKFQFLRQFNS